VRVNLAIKLGNFMAKIWKKYGKHFHPLSMGKLWVIYG
jgi:hypothetical protein